MTLNSAIVKQWGWTFIPAIGALLLAVFFVLPPASTEQSIVYDVIGLFAIGAAIVGITYLRPTGWRPWLLIAAGQLAFVVGDIPSPPSR